MDEMMFTMQATLQKIHEDSVPASIDAPLSFKPFLRYLKERLKTERTVKSEYYRFVIERFEKEQAWNLPISPDDIARYRELLEIVYFVLTPLATDEKEFFWGLSTPIPGSLIFSTSRLSQFLADKNTMIHQQPINGNKSCGRQEVQFIYRLILERFYGIATSARKELIFEHKDTTTNLLKFYQVQVDTQFIDIRVKSTLPELKFDTLSPYLHDGDGTEAMVCMLQQMLPLENFEVEGFSIVTLRDITQPYALDKIREVIANHLYSNEKYRIIGQALKTMAGHEHIEFRLVPMVGVNGKAVFVNKEESIQSVLILAAQKSGIEGEVFNALVSAYQKNPRVIVLNKIQSEASSTERIVPMLKVAGLTSFALLPVYYHHELTGVLEIFSRKDVLFDERLFSKVQDAVPLIAQLLKYSREAFQSTINNIIRDKFTPLQPAVQWKFNEAAWKHLQEHGNDVKSAEIETIRFDNIYPLYGAVDIRNSTIERNRAIQEDIRFQLTLLTETLRKLKNSGNLPATQALAFECEQWFAQIESYMTTKDEITLNHFLEQEVNPYLRHAHREVPSARPLIDAYFDALNEQEGDAFKNRRELETSLQYINKKLNHYFDNAQKELQAVYPFYFEKFRTDGIEYDIYIGQSIGHDKVFDIAYLKRLRKWQLQSMAEVARLTQQLTPAMPRPLQTTQLIFAHAHRIDITFRNDERRFDVEGAYNIRYEMIKKRIDKVLIRDTGERLTQPGKIALVYLNTLEAQEYIEYIGELQQQGLLDDSLEFLELEEVQGVSRLKALRVGVKYI